MAKFNFKKIKWKKIICFALAGVALVAVIGGAAALFNKDSKKISWTKFSRGDIDATTGAYVESNKGLCTKEAFECIGLRVVPDFDAKLSYDVHYYDYNGVLLESRTDIVGVYDEDFPLAKTARIAIHPEIPDGVKEKDFEIGFFEVNDYADKLTITVDKDQNYKYNNCVNLYNSEAVRPYETFYSDSVKASEWNVLDASLAENTLFNTTGLVPVSSTYTKYDIYVKCREADLPPNSYIVAVLANEDGSIYLEDDEPVVAINNIENATTFVWHKLTIEVPDDCAAEYLRVTMPSDTIDCYIFGY